MRQHLRVAAFTLAIVLAAAAGAVSVTYSNVASGTGDEAAITGKPNLRLCGFSIAENAGTPAAARVRLRHGDADTDPVIVDLHLAASQSAWDFFDCQPVPDGVFVDRVSGTTVVTVMTRQYP